MPRLLAPLVGNTQRITTLTNPAAGDDAISREYVEGRGTGVISNGSGLMGDNYNFSTFAFDPVETHGGGGSFRINVAQQARFSDELIPVDPEKRWTLVGWAKSGDVSGANFNAANRQYFGIAQLDIDGLAATAAHNQRVVGSTDTTLAAPLNPGDPTITLTDATGWYSGATTAARHIAWWPYTNAKGYTWPDYTYTRNVSASGTWNAGAIAGNVITLAAPWAGAALAAGTKVRNAQDGGSSGYKYIAAGNVTVPNAWTRYEGYLSGQDTTYNGDNFKFGVGTAYVRLLFLVNYHGAADNNVRWSDLSLTDNLSASATAGGDLSGAYPNPNVVKSVGNFTVGGRLLVPTVGQAAGLLLGGDANLYRSAADTLATDDALYVAKTLGIAVAPNPDWLISAVSTTVNSPGGYGLYTDLTAQQTTNLANTFIGVSGIARIDAALATGAVTGWSIGMRGLAAYNGGGTARNLTNLIGIRAELSSLNAAGSVTNATAVYAQGGTLQMPTTNYYGVRINAPALAGGGSLVSAYGLYIPSYAGVVASGAVHAIYVAGGTSRLDGALGLGVAPGATGRLQLVAGTTPADGILFGTDTNLYRESADTLTTDDTLHVQGNVVAESAVSLKGDLTANGGDIIVTKNPGSAKVLTSDATGRGTWQTPPGGSFKLPVFAASDAWIDTTAPGSTFDGQLVPGVGSRILLLNQEAGAGALSKPELNGIWVYNGPAVPLTRPTDFNSAASVEGAFVVVTEGAKYRDTAWMQTTDPPLVFHTDPLFFRQLARPEVALSSSAPTTPLGTPAYPTLWVDTDDSALRYWNGSWQPVVATSAKPALVSALPVGPADGDEVYFQDATLAALGVVWHLRYRTASASTYKWEFLGGPPLRANVDTDQTFTAGATYVDAATVGPQVTLPLAGDYTYHFNVNMYVSGQTAAGNGAVGLSLAGAQPTGVDLSQVYLTSGIGGVPTRNGALFSQPSARVVKVVQAIGTALGGTPHVRFRELQVTPVRVA